MTDHNGTQTRSTFSGSLGFVLAAAGSAVGLGNIWRFPYLAAKNGGAVFILVYILLALTFGFALVVTEIAEGDEAEVVEVFEDSGSITPPTDEEWPN